MSNKIIAFYDDLSARGGEDARATSSRAASLEFYYTKQAMDEYITGSSRVLEVGCGTGYYGMYYADRCKEYVGIELYQPHVDIFNRKIAENKLKNVSCRQGDATHLTKIDDGSFDVVCCFGPMYHLSQPDRELVFAECARVCKPGGVVAFAYINKIGAYAGACILDEEHYPNKLANDYLLRQGTDDLRPGVFFFTTPEQMQQTASYYGLEKIRSMGTDYFVTMGAVNKMDDEKFAAYIELADEMVKHESCAGMSNHALLICRKNASAAVNPAANPTE